MTITRIFNAPRALVFDAWTKPEHLKRWSAPRGFTVTRSEGELHPGGSWRAAMRGPDGVELPLSGKYREIIRNELLVFTHGWEDESGAREHETVVTVRFADYGPKTKVTLEQGPFDSVQERDGHQGGWSECLDRLVEHLELSQIRRTRKKEMKQLAEIKSEDLEIVSTRTFSASREAVFDAFADPARLTQWWGPKGFTNTFREFDFKRGGLWRFTMHGPDGAEYPNESEFLEVVKPERIVFQHMLPMHRFQMTMLLRDQNGKTEFTWRMLFESAAECGQFKPFIIEANEQNFDRLAAHLAKAV